MSEQQHAERVPEAVLRRRRLGVSLVWLVPVVAVLLGLSLVVRSIRQSGLEITITFQSAEGLEAGKTQVKYKNVVIGKVSKVELSQDHRFVDVIVTLHEDAESFASDGTRFWVVRPRIGAGGVSGIDTLLSGAFIGADIGDSHNRRRHFKGLEMPPSILHGQPGKSFVLHADDLGSLDIGSPVYYRRIPVGHVASYRLEPEGKGVSVEIFIDAPNDRFVTGDSRFWNASGVDFSIDAHGVQVNTQSLATVLAGGVAFEELPGPHDSTPAVANTGFQLFGDRETAMAPPDGPSRYLRMRFSQSLRGLVVGAPVEFSGLAIGKVVSIKLDYDEKTHTFPTQVAAIIYPSRLGVALQKLDSATTRVSDDKDGRLLSRMVAAGLRAQARSGNLLTGQLYIALDFMPHATPVAFNAKAHLLEIPTVTGSFEKAQEQLASIVDKLDKLPFERIADHLDDSLKETQQTIKIVNKQILPELNGTMQGLQQTMNTTHNLLSNDSPMQRNLNGALEQLQRTARSLRAFTDELGEQPTGLLRGRMADPSFNSLERQAAEATGDLQP